jgi:hypothetical protein
LLIPGMVRGDIVRINTITHQKEDFPAGDARGTISAMRKDDPQFKKLMDDTIAQVQTSGEAEKWFDKWFKNPIPPKNLNMNFELSDEMKALFKEPNDKALN